MPSWRGHLMVSEWLWMYRYFGLFSQARVLNTCIWWNEL